MLTYCMALAYDKLLVLYAKYYLPISQLARAYVATANYFNGLWFPGSHNSSSRSQVLKSICR